MDFHVSNNIYVHKISGKRQSFVMELHEDITIRLIWVKIFKNGPSKICGSQPLKNLK